MAKNFHEQFDRPELALPPDRSTGLVFAVVSAIVAYFWRSSDTVFYIAGALACGFTAVSFIKPILLRPLNIVWMKFAMLLHKIVNPVIMLLLFAVAIIPTGLLMQLVRDPLRKKPEANTKSYWIERKPDKNSSMVNQF